MYKFIFYFIFKLISGFKNYFIDTMLSNYLNLTTVPHLSLLLVFSNHMIFF